MTFGAAFDPIRALKHGWTAFKINPLWFFLAALLAHCGESGGSGGGGGGGGQPDAVSSDLPVEISSFADFLTSGAAGVAALIGLFCVLVFLLLRSWWWVGYIRLQADTVIYGDSAENRLFSGLDRLGAFFVLTLARWLALALIGLATFAPATSLAAYGSASGEGVAVFVGMALMLVTVPLGLFAAVYVALGLALAPHALVLDDLAPVDAMRQSWESVRGHRIQLFIYFFVHALFVFAAALVGLLVFCVGALFTIPTAQGTVDLGLTQSYLFATRDRSELDAYWLTPI